MSSRFGRNKRRRAREAVAQLEARLAAEAEAREADRGLLRWQGEQLWAAREEIARAKRIAGPHSVLFSPSTVHHGGRPGDTVRLAPPAQAYVDLGLDVEASEAWLRNVELDVLLADVDRGWLDEALHARIEFADKEVCYGISAVARDSMGRYDLEQTLVRQAAPMMVRVLVEKLFENKGGRGDRRDEGAVGRAERRGVVG